MQPRLFLLTQGGNVFIESFYKTLTDNINLFSSHVCSKATKAWLWLYNSEHLIKVWERNTRRDMFTELKPQPVLGFDQTF